MNPSNQCKKLYDDIDWKSLSVLPTGCIEIKELLQKIENLQSVCIRLNEPIPSLVNLWIKKLKKNECVSGTKTEPVKAQPVVSRVPPVVYKPQPVVSRVPPVVYKPQPVVSRVPPVVYKPEPVVSRVPPVVSKDPEPPIDGYIIVDGKIKYGARFKQSVPFNEGEKALLIKNGYTLEDLLEPNIRNGTDNNDYKQLRKYINEIVPENERPLKPEEKEILRKKGFDVSRLLEWKQYWKARLYLNETPLTEEEKQKLKSNGWNLNNSNISGLPSFARKFLNVNYAEYEEEQRRLAEEAESRNPYSYSGK